MKNFTILFLVLSLSSCTHLFFQPDRYLHIPPEKLKVEYQNIYFDSTDKTRLHSWFLPRKDQSQKAKGLIVLYHGNAQNLSSHYISVSWMTRFQYDVWVWDYRGYGLSQGVADSSGVYQDSLAALEFAVKMVDEKKYPKLIMVGQSLGGNILMRALHDSPHKDKVDAVVLDSTFLGYKDIAFDRLTQYWFTYLFSPLSYVLVSDEYSAKEVVNNITHPALVIHGNKDAIIPFRFGEEVYAKLGSEKKEFLPVKEAGHINSIGMGREKINQILLDFIERVTPH